MKVGDVVKIDESYHNHFFRETLGIVVRVTVYGVEVRTSIPYLEFKHYNYTAPIYPNVRVIQEA